MRNIFAMLLIASASFAAMNVAVLEITVPEDNEDIEIGVEETKFLTDELRSQAVSILPQDKYTVLTREGMISKFMQQSEEERKRLSSASAVEIGKAIGTEYVAQGKINIFGDKLSLKVEFYETASGKLLGSFTGESGNATGFLGVIREKAPPMFDKIVPKEKPVRDTLTPPPPPPSPSFKIGVVTRAGFAKSGVKEGGSGLAYSAGFVLVKNFGFLDLVPEVLFSSEEFEINDRKASIMNVEIPLTARVVLADVLGISLGAVAAFPLSSKIESEAPKDIANFGIAATGGLSYMFTDDIFVNAFYVKYFTENFKSVKDSNTDKVLCGISYLF